MSTTPDQLEIVRQLRAQLDRVDHSGTTHPRGAPAPAAPAAGSDSTPQTPQENCFSTGCTELDQLLPAQGLRHGSLVQWYGESGGSLLAVLAASHRLQQTPHQHLVVVDWLPSNQSTIQRAPTIQQAPTIQRASTIKAPAAQGSSASRPAASFFLYPPAVSSWGVCLARTAWVRVTNQADHHWAVDQSLRCSAVGAVLCWPRQLDDVTFRRWQLAAESSGATGLLVCPTTSRGNPSWADVRWLAAYRTFNADGLPSKGPPSKGSRSQGSTQRGSVVSGWAVSGWELEVCLVGCRGGLRMPRGDLPQVILRIDEQGSLQAITDHQSLPNPTLPQTPLPQTPLPHTVPDHETPPLPVASQLADPASVSGTGDSADGNPAGGDSANGDPANGAA